MFPFMDVERFVLPLDLKFLSTCHFWASSFPANKTSEYFLRWFRCLVLYVCPVSALNQQIYFNYKLIFVGVLYIDGRLQTLFSYIGITTWWTNEHVTCERYYHNYNRIMHFDVVCTVHRPTIYIYINQQDAQNSCD